MNVNRRWKSSVVLCLLVSGAVACGGDEELVTARVTAILEGTVRNGLTRAPIEGATVRILGARGENGHVEATTDADGRYRAVFGGAGRFTYEVEIEDFARVKSTVTFDPNDFAVEGTNGSYTVTQLLNQDLFPLVGTLRAHVYGNQFRDWISDAPITLTFSSSIDDPSLTTRATTDDTGSFELAGLPAGTSFTVTVRATDRDGDGVLDTNGTAFSVTLEADTITEIFIGPVGAYTGPGILWSNLDNMRSWPTNPEFDFIFRTAMDTDRSSTVVNLRDNVYGTMIASRVAWDDDGTQLTISPVDTLVPGREYTLSFTSWSRNAEQVSSGGYSFRVQGGSDAQPMITGLEWLDDPTEQDLFDTTFRVGIDPVENVDRIRIYGRNSVRSSDWVFIQDAFPNAGFPKNELTINISGSAAALLTSFPGGTTTFFGRGETLELAAAAVINNVEGPLSAPIELTDEKCLDVEIRTGTDNTPTSYFDNTDGTTPKPIVIEVVAMTIPGFGARDYFAEDAEAELTIANGPLSPDAFVLDASTLEGVRRDRSTFAFTGTIPADRDAQLDLITVALDSLSDPSGNPVCQSALEAFTPGRRGAGIPAMTWDFQANAQGWTGSGSFTRGSGDGPNATSNIWGTGLGASRPDNVTSVLRSPRFQAPTSYSLTWYELRAQDAADSVRFVFANDDEEWLISHQFQSGPTVNGYNYYSLFNLPANEWGQIEIHYTAGTPAGGAGTSTALGFRLDDVTLTGYWQRTIFYDGTN